MLGRLKSAVVALPPAQAAIVVAVSFVSIIAAGLLLWYFRRKGTKA